MKLFSRSSRSHRYDMSSQKAPTGPFPTAHPIPSYWRNSTKPIDSHRSTETLPSKTDIVIIGAGYSGASIAHHLIQESERHGRPIPSIVILEAREACSGATGRNGMSLTPHQQPCWESSVLRLSPRRASQTRSVLEGGKHSQDAWHKGR